MADNLQTLATLVLAQNYKGDIVRQVNRRATLLSILKWVQGEGKNIAWVPEGSGALAEMYSEGADAANFGSDSQNSATIPWASGRANIHISGLAKATAATSRTPLGDIELWARNMVNGGAALASTLNAELYTGSATLPHLTGLDVAIGTLNNTYAGIDRSSVTAFNSNVFGASDPSNATALTFGLIRSDLAAIYIASGMRPDIAPVHPNMLVAMAALFDPQKQYKFEVVREGNVGKGKVVFEGGIGAIYFDGCYFIEDKDCPDHSIYYLNTDVVDVEYLPANMSVKGVPGMDDESVDMIATDGFVDTPLGMRLEMLSKTGDADKAQMKAYLNLAVRRPNACGKRLNLAA